MTKNPKAIAAVLFLIAAALLFFLSLDIYNISAANKETSRILNQVDESAKEKNLVQSIRLFQNEARADIEEFQSMILTSSGLVPVIESIETSGRSVGLETKIISVDKPKSEGGQKFQIIRMVIETTGPWEGTALFMHALESLPYRVTIEESRLTKEDTKWALKTTLSLYSFDN